MTNTVFITGILGQDGAYLAKFLLEKGYKVIGGKRRSSSPNDWRLKRLGIEKDVELVYFDFFDGSSIQRYLEKYKPTQVYNLAAQSFVECSFEMPIYTSNIDYTGVGVLLESIRNVNNKIKFYQASSSEMYGKVQAIPQSENTPFYPRSPYAVAKLAAHWITVNYRESYDLHATSGILFNHESPLRGEEFVTRKITTSLVKIKKNLQECLYLGNIDAKRDWGFAKEYVEAMYLMLQQQKPDDYVIATNNTHTVRYFCEKVSSFLGWDLQWRGTGQFEEGFCSKTGKVLIKIDPSLYRKAEVDLLLGDPSKAKHKLGWQANTKIDELAQIMTEADMYYC